MPHNGGHGQTQEVTACSHLMPRTGAPLMPRRYDRTVNINGLLRAYVLDSIVLSSLIYAMQD